MLHKQLNKEKAWYEFHIDREKWSMVGKRVVKDFHVYEHAKHQIHNSILS